MVIPKVGLKFFYKEFWHPYDSFIFQVTKIEKNDVYIKVIDGKFVRPWNMKKIDLECQLLKVATSTTSWEINKQFTDWLSL